jgi:hypothetical protein
MREGTQKQNQKKKKKQNKTKQKGKYLVELRTLKNICAGKPACRLPLLWPHVDDDCL